MNALGEVDASGAPAAESTAPSPLASAQDDAVARSGDSPLPEASALESAMESQLSTTEEMLNYATPVVGAKSPPEAFEDVSSEADAQPVATWLSPLRIVQISLAVLIVGLLVAMVVVRRRAL